MIWLLLGLALWWGAHLVKPLAPALRARAVARIGEGPWRGCALVALIVSIWLMSVGYGAAAAPPWWVLPNWGKHLIAALMLPALMLVVGSYPGSLARSVVRHPQLTGFKLWAALHLIANGDLRSTVLFGGLLAWAVVTVVALNRRDGRPPLPEPSPSPVRRWGFAVVGMVAWAALIALHPWLFGVSPIR